MDSQTRQGGLVGRTPAPRRALVIYDGGCRLCRAFARAVAVVDRRRRLRMQPFGDPEAEALLAPLPAAARHASFHVAGDHGLASGADAARQVLLLVPGGRAAVALELHRVYPIVARHRRRLGRLVPRVAVTRVA